MTRFILITAGVTGVLFLGFLIDRQSSSPAVRAAGRLEQNTVFAPGWVEGTSLEIELRPQLAGRIIRVAAREGQAVKQGDVLLELDPQEYRQQVALAQAKLSLAEAKRERLVNGARTEERAVSAALLRAKLAELERAQLAWNRIHELQEANAVSQQEADNQRTLVTALEAEVEAVRSRRDLVEAAARPDEVAMAQARIDAARAELELARVQEGRTRLCAPCPGRVLDVAVEPGELTGPNDEQPTIVMVNTDRLRVRAFVDELDAPRVRVGMTVRVTADGLPNQVFRGRVTELSPRMVRKELRTDRSTELQDTKTREIWIDLERPDDLVVGLRVDAVIELPPLASGEQEKLTYSTERTPPRDGVRPKEEHPSNSTVQLILM